jgi:hypothetical protein
MRTAFFARIRMLNYAIGGPFRPFYDAASVYHENFLQRSAMKFAMAKNNTVFNIMLQSLGFR